MGNGLTPEITTIYVLVIGGYLYASTRFGDTTVFIPEPHIGRRFQGALAHGANPGLKPWAVLYSRFRLRPISPSSYVGQVAAKFDGSASTECCGLKTSPTPRTQGAYPVIAT
jgi:hypothetical protein